MTTDPHVHEMPQYSGIGAFVLFNFAADVDDFHAFQYSIAHSALIYPQEWADQEIAVDLRGQQYGAIVTHIYGGGTNKPLYDLLVQTRYGAFFFQGVRHVSEPIADAFCALPCLNSGDPSGNCAFPGFCNPEPGDPPGSIPCPVVNSALCRWQQVKVGYWESLPQQLTSLPI